MSARKHKVPTRSSLGHRDCNQSPIRPSAQASRDIRLCRVEAEGT